MLLSSSAALVVSALALAQPAPAGAAPRGLMLGADPKTLAFETQVLGELNQVRAAASLPPLTMDERLRQFARKYAEHAAKGEPQAGTVNDAIKQQGLAPHGYRTQFSYGATAKRLMDELRKDRAAMTSVQGEFARVGVGAFWVPVEQPYFQVMLLLAADQDPRAGQPGLSPEQTNPVMNAAAERLRSQCYEAALKDDPNLKGEVLFQIVIGAQGKVDSAKLLKKLGSASFDDCGLRLVQGLTFPVPYKGKPVTLNHPMRFTPPQGDRVIGKLTVAQIDTTFRQASTDLRACYDARLKLKPGLAGTLTLALVVEPTGAVRSVEIKEDTLRDEQVGACVLARSKRLVFPAPKHGGEVDVTFPIKFDSNRPTELSK